MGNAFLSHIREGDALPQVVRVFEDSDVLHVSNRIIRRGHRYHNTELMLPTSRPLKPLAQADLGQAKGDPEAKGLIPGLEQLKDALERGTLATNRDTALSWGGAVW